jgi:phosphoribosyl 1,2-cyclic phosphodiesterase
LVEGLKVRFWGVRGSISCPGAEYVRYGGNTSCLEITAGGRRLIFDAGTGIRTLGVELARQAPLDIDIYFTHTHLDHISGLTFFAPLFERRNSVRMWAGHLEAPYTLKKVVGHLMQAPLYPVSLDVFQARVEFREFKSGENLSCGAVAVSTTPLNHPNGATGYRIDHLGKSICYITDTEHREGQRDSTIVELCRGADVMIYDSSYTDEEYARYRGWAPLDLAGGRAGRRCGGRRHPWRSFITIPATTMRSWTVSRGKPPSHARASRQAACRVSSSPTKASH